MTTPRPPARPTGPPALLGEWLESRGIDWESATPRAASRCPSSRTCASSPRSVPAPLPATRRAEVEAETELDRARRRATCPCSACASAARCSPTCSAGAWGPRRRPEFGWMSIETDEPARFPAGPWLAWHYERYTVPPGATEIARTEHSHARLPAGPHLGVQFHPESTHEIVAGWARKDGERLGTVGVTDGLALPAAAPTRAGRGDAAFRLFDAFMERMIHPRRSVRWPSSPPKSRRRRRDPSVPSASGSSSRPPRGHPRQGRADRRVRPRGRARPRVLLGDHGHRPAPHAGRRLRGGLPGPGRQARPSTLTLLPWEPGVACCIAESGARTRSVPPADPRGASARPSPASRSWATARSSAPSSSSSCASPTRPRPTASAAAWTT